MSFGLYIVFYSAAILGFFIVALLVALRQNGAAHRNFATFAFLLGVWQLLQFTAQLLNSLPLAAILLELSVSVITFVGTYFLIFAASRTGRKVRLMPLILATIAFSALAPFSNSLQNALISREGIAVASIDIFYGLPVLFAALCTTYGLSLIFLHFRASNDPRQRRQDLILLLGVLQGVVSILLFSIFASGSVYSQIAAPVATLIAACIIAYTIAYQGLFDIHFFVVRAAAYITTLFVTTFVFVAPIVLAFAYFLDFHPTHRSELVVIVLFSVIALYLLQYLHRFFNKITEKLFFRRYYDPQDVLDSLSDLLVRTADIEELRSGTAQILQEALKPDQIRYVLFADQDPTDAEVAKKISRYKIAGGTGIIDVDELGSDSRDKGLIVILKDESAALTVKLRTTHEDLGYIMLGYRQSGEAYSTRDKRLLSVAADEIAISLQNALRFKEIQRFNVTLQEKVDRATRELRRTNKRLEELDETKDDFISMASHQLRTPLTSVKGYLSMVLEGDAGRLNSSQAKMLNQAFTSSQRMVYLITDLLNVSRLKTGKFVINAAAVDLSNLAEEEVSQLVETAEARHIELSYKRPASFPLLMLDETKIRQVIMNFIDNAIYYTPAGGHIRVELSDRPATIELKVVDDGIGVPKAEQHHLFTKFYRAANARKARPDGTGLGLFMAKKVIAAQGGSIVFSSKEGQGSAFGFVFSKNLLRAPDQTATARTTSQNKTP